MSALLALLPKQAPQLNLLALSDAPNFCPEFLAVKEVELGLDNSHIRALATQVRQAHPLQSRVQYCTDEWTCDAVRLPAVTIIMSPLSLH